MNQQASRRDPLSALENQDLRLRRDAVKATKFVTERLSGSKLRDFIEQLAVFLRSFEGTPKPEPLDRGGVS